MQNNYEKSKLKHVISILKRAQQIVCH